jgi:hypothetical protein
MKFYLSSVFQPRNIVSALVRYQQTRGRKLRADDEVRLVLETTGELACGRLLAHPNCVSSHLRRQEKMLVLHRFSDKLSGTQTHVFHNVIFFVDCSCLLVLQDLNSF